MGALSQGGGLSDSLYPPIQYFDSRAGRGGDDSAFFLLAAQSHETVYCPKAVYNVTAVSIDVWGCDFRFHKEAVINVTGAGFNRNIPQVLRAVWIANGNPLLDAINYYYTLRISGGRWFIAANATAISDRVPFLVYTGLVPAPAHPGVLIARNMEVRRAEINLTDPTSVAIGINGGWGTMVSGNNIQGYNCGTAFSISPSAANGDIDADPQEITIKGNQVNSCIPFVTATNGCTNSCQDLKITGNNRFNYVQASTLGNVNCAEFSHNMYVTLSGSFDWQDGNFITIADNYLEADQAPANVNKMGIVNAINCQSLKYHDNQHLIPATSTGAQARYGLALFCSAGNPFVGTEIVDNRFNHFTRAAGLSTAAIYAQIPNGAAPAALFDDFICERNQCNDFWYAVQFSDGGTGNKSTNVRIKDLTNKNGIAYLSGATLLDQATLDAPQYFQQFNVSLQGVAVAGGAITTIQTNNINQYVQRVAPAFTVSGFAGSANAQDIVVAYSQQCIQISLRQAAIAVAGTIVTGTATIAVDGTLL